MKYLFTFLLLTFFVSSHAQKSDEWVLISKSPDSSRIYYLNAIRMQKTDEGIKGWVKVTYQTKIVKGIEYDKPYTLAYQLFDCVGQRDKNLQLITYSNSGDILEDYTYEPYEQRWNNIPPESISEALLKVICLVNGK